MFLYWGKIYEKNKKQYQKLSKEEIFIAIYPATLDPPRENVAK